MKNKYLKFIYISLLILLASNLAHGKTIPSTAQVHKNNLEIFSPNPTSKQHINYDAWGNLLEVMVLSTGQSTRESAPKQSPPTGSRLIFSHTSRYRMEGNKIAFSRFNPEFTALISTYREELETIGNSINIANLSRNEQLAYWMNLHNVVIIEQIALAYPEKSPASLKVGIQKELLHDAKIINIRQQALSLRDIREGIIYSNWSSPEVMYGFFLGDLGSPSIQSYAFSSENIQTALDVIAYEFANSLRGFRQGRISKIYSDNAKYFFPDFQRDINTHLNKYMRTEVAEELSRYEDLKIAKYPYRIADVVGGYGNRKSGLAIQRTSQDGDTFSDISNNAFADYMTELRRKSIRLRELGLTNRGTVIIEDIETIVNETETGETK